ncbi:EAL domain-containing protein [Deinococcus sp. UYEF24]
MILLSVFGFLHLSWYLLRWGTPGSQPFLAGFLYVPVFLTAAWCCALTARQTAARERVAWICFSLGVLAFGLGQTVFTLHQAVLHEVPFPSAADGLFLLLPPLVAVALILLPHTALSRVGWLRLGLDVSIMTAAAAVFSWRFLLSRLLQAYSGQPLAGTIALAYPVSDLMLLCLMLLLISRRQRHQGPVIGLIASALASFIVADTGFAQLSASNSYVPGDAIDLFWSLGGLLFGVAAVRRGVSSAGLRPDSSDAPKPPASQRLTAYGPYFAVIAAYVLLLLTFENGTITVTDRGVLWSTAVVTLLVIVRQIVAFRENAALHRELQRAARELELRVDARTAELHVANTQLLVFSEGLEEKVRSRTAELELSQARLAYQAQHDALTGLPNRMLFDDRLGRAVATAVRHGRKLAVMYIDLDGFKLVNDTLGHAAGDRVLQVTAQRLQQLVRHSDTLARLGGDEFTMLLNDLTDNASVEHVAQHVREVVSQNILIGEQVANVTASIGIALYPDDALDAEALKRQADAAMYRIKQGGKNGMCFFAPEMNSASRLRSELATRLREALKLKEFHLVYQPQFATGSQELLAFEALLRWSPHDLGPVPPSEFIPIAEETGLITEIGAWVLDEVCRQQAEWQRSGLRPVMVAVNVSPLQFSRAGFVDDLRHSLCKHELNGRWIELELTEQVMLNDVSAVAQKMMEVRSLGTSISVDDFGAGRTALSYLLELPVNTVKIDRSLIQGIGSAQGKFRVVQAIVALAHALNLSVVAEGVETRAQLASVTDLQCDRVQGFLLGLPETASGVGDRLREPPLITSL